MEMPPKLIGQILFDLVDEAENEFVAFDMYTSKLHKRILLKERTGVDYKDDLDLYIILQGYKGEITNKVFQNNKKGEIK